MNYADALSYIENYTDYEKTPVSHAAANYDLRRLEELLNYFDNPHLKTKTVHITGTKGKGSTAAMIAGVLTEAGFSTGLYTSPHLIDLRERIRINNCLITEEDLVDIIVKLKPVVDEVNRKANFGEITTFELLTSIAFIYFAKKNVDFQVLEVGMGGTYDATNIIKTPEVCVITPVSLDHTEVLGNNLTDIATEKSGIIKSGCTVVTSPQKSEVLRTISDLCEKHKAKLIEVGNDVKWRDTGFDTNSQGVMVAGRLNSYNLTVPLLGRHQLVNAATAVAALEVLMESGFNITINNIEKGMAALNWPGRFQIIGRHPLVVVDGAHNPESAHNLRETVLQYLQTDKVVLVIGTSADKDIEGISDELSPIAGIALVTTSHHPRAMAPERIAGAFTKRGVPVETALDVPAALTRAIAIAGDSGTICVTGSLFIVGETLKISDQFEKC